MLLLVAGHEWDAFGLGQSGGEGIGVGERETGLDMGGGQSGVIQADGPQRAG